MKSKLIFWLSLLTVGLNGQHLDFRSSFGSYDFIYNPSMTANYPVLDFGVSYKSQWIGFDAAPRTAAVFGQLSLSDNRMGLGAFYSNDNTGSFENNILGFTYRYGFSPTLISGYDQLSFGLGLGLGSIRIDKSVLSLASTDVLRLEERLFNRNTAWSSFGFLYTSDLRLHDFYRSGWRFGGSIRYLALDQLSDFNIKESDMHFSGIASYRFNLNESFFEPTLWWDRTRGYDLFTLDMIFEMQDQFWMGISLQSNSTVGFQFGGILNNELLGDGSLRVGAHASYGLGSTLSIAGFSWQAVISYRFITE